MGHFLLLIPVIIELHLVEGDNDMRYCQSKSQEDMIRDSEDEARRLVHIHIEQELEQTSTS